MAQERVLSGESDYRPSSEHNRSPAVLIDFAQNQVVAPVPYTGNALYNSAVRFAKFSLP